MSTLSVRKAIALDTIARSEEVVSSVPEATLDSFFISSQLPPLPTLDDAHASQKVAVEVINSDSFVAARQIMRNHSDAIGKTAVLNLASDERRGGGWDFTLSRTQEEALCYSSTLFSTLKQEYYPWPNLGPGSVAGVYSPAVVIFKDDLAHECVDLPGDQWRVVSVITVAAPRGPQLTKDGTKFQNPSDLEDLRGKIRLVYRIAGHHGQEYIVLGAMGCGAYCCPPRLVAEEMKSILLEPEFRGRFGEIVFAVFAKDDNPNFDLFREVLDGVQI